MRAEYEQINWTNWYKLKDFVVFDVPNEWIPYNVFNEIWDFLHEWWIIPNFDKDRNLIDSLYSNYILIEYLDKYIRSRDIENNSKINIINSIKSESIDKNWQLAENTWNFEFNWKYYLVIYPYNSLTDEINPEKWLFRWVIIDSDKYFQVNNQVNDSNSQVQDVLNK